MILQHARGDAVCFNSGELKNLDLRGKYGDRVNNRSNCSRARDGAFAETAQERRRWIFGPALRVWVGEMLATRVIATA
jgi:hypothetical protein